MLVFLVLCPSVLLWRLLLFATSPAWFVSCLARDWLQLLLLLKSMVVGLGSVGDRLQLTALAVSWAVRFII